MRAAVIKILSTTGYEAALLSSSIIITSGATSFPVEASEYR